MEARHKKMCTQASVTVFVFYAGHGFVISFVPTDASCTVKWSLCVSSCAWISERLLSVKERILLNLFEQRKRMEQNDPCLFVVPFWGVRSADCCQSDVWTAFAVARFSGEDCTERRKCLCGEVDALKEVAQSMRLSVQEVDSMLNLRAIRWKMPTKVLKSNLQLRMRKSVKAYRNLVLKHHPDRGLRWEEDISGKLPKKSYNASMMPGAYFQGRGMK